MKAYKIEDRAGYVPYVIIAFAERRGKAVTYALGTDEFPDCDFCFTDLSATRAKWADKYYRGKPQMDWDNPEDRLAMVSEGGFYCGEDYFDPDECEKCSAKEECEKYCDYKEDNWLE